MRFLVAGGSGFLGSHLIARLRGEGHDITQLVRRAPGGPDESQWQPAEGVIDAEVVAAADVVVNVAGSPTAGNPHSDKWARELRKSRVSTTRLLAEAIAQTGGGALRSITGAVRSTHTRAPAAAAGSVADCHSRVTRASSESPLLSDASVSGSVPWSP